MAIARPRFTPSPCKPTSYLDPPPLYGNTNVTWTPIITCPADFPASLVRTFRHCLTSFASPRSALVPRSLKIPSAAVRTCHLPAYPSSRVQLDAHPAIRSHRRLRRRVSRRRPGPRRSTAGSKHTSQAPPTSPDARRGARAALHALRAFAIIPSDRRRHSKLAPPPHTSHRARAHANPSIGRRRPPVLPPDGHASRLSLR